jgi:hypothetical protein
MLSSPIKQKWNFNFNFIFVLLQKIWIMNCWIMNVIRKSVPAN